MKNYFYFALALFLVAATGAEAKIVTDFGKDIVVDHVFRSDAMREFLHRHGNAGVEQAGLHVIHYQNIAGANGFGNYTVTFGFHMPTKNCRALAKTVVETYHATPRSNRPGLRSVVASRLSEVRIDANSLACLRNPNPVLNPGAADPASENRPTSGPRRALKLKVVGNLNCFHNPNSRMSGGRPFSCQLL